jgi:hypothetical protein
MSNNGAFAHWFQHATGKEPYPFQIRFACEDWLPEPVEGGLSPIITGKGEGPLVDVRREHSND